MHVSCKESLLQVLDLWFFSLQKPSFHDPVRTEEQGRNLLGRLYHRENGFGTRITTTEEQLQGSDTLPLLPCALCSVFTATEAQRKEQRCRNKKGNLPFLPSLLRFRPASARVDPF